MTTLQKHPKSLIGLRLKPEDHARVERIAELEQRALGTLCRIFVLKCLTEYEQSLQPSPAAKPTTAA